MHRVVLIGGMPRSGTNLARRIIGSHSKIAMPSVELHFLKKYENGSSVKQILTEEKFKRRFELDVSDLYLDSPRDVYVSLLARYAESVGKPILGEKSPGNEFHFEKIREWLKGFEIRFIHLVRNPFDVIASFKHAPFRGEGRRGSLLEEVASLAEEWNRSLNLGLARAFHQPQEYCLTRFEDLTSDAVGTTGNWCKFIGVDYEQDRMLNLSDYSAHSDNTSFAANSASDSGDSGRVRSVESRKGHLTQQEIRTVAFVCGELARAIGYEDKDFDVDRMRSENSDHRVRRSLARIGRWIGGNRS